MKLKLEPKRILIFRPGSLGDTVVALPCFHLLARLFPNADRRVLTNVPGKSVQVAVESVLNGSGLTHGYFAVDYRQSQKNVYVQWSLWKQIRQWKPDLLIHLTDLRNLRRLAAEFAFFKFCGVRRIVGMPLQRELRGHGCNSEQSRFEHEAARLARCLSALGDARVDDPASWDLRLRDEERRRADAALAPLQAGSALIVCSVGTAVEVKDWGIANWLSFIGRLAEQAPGYGLALVGAPNEFERSELVRSKWPGHSVNLCGMLTVRETAAAIESASAYIGHDSGPMHLAAAVGVPCVAIFSARQLPGVWFPFGSGHQVIYHNVPCRNCGLDKCEHYQKRCITSITVEEVLQAADKLLGPRRKWSDVRSIRDSMARQT